MTKDEFIDACFQGGYCSKSVAREYAKDKDKFTESDIEEAFRLEQDRKSKSAAHNSRFKNYQGAKSTKRLLGGTRDDEEFTFNY